MPLGRNVQEYLRLVDAFTHVQKNGEVCPANWEEGKTSMKADRGKVRCFRLKQCGRKYSIFKFLRSFGIPINTTWYVIIDSQGWWKMSSKVAVAKAMGNHWFAQQGLHSLRQRMNRF